MGSDQLAVSVSRAAQMVGIGRTTLYAEIAKGSLKAIKCGHRTLIPIPELTGWLGRLPPIPTKGCAPKVRNSETTTYPRGSVSDTEAPPP
ncbi:MAG: excisionase family DNA-binding protein [Alphaproteobacteria bacterium]